MEPTKTLSLEDRAMVVRNAFDKLFENAMHYGWATEIYADHAIVCMGMNEYYRADYTIADDGAVMIAPKDGWKHVEKERIAKSLVAIGGEVKSVNAATGEVSGYLIYFGEPDASPARDVFTKSTDFDIDWDADNTAYVRFEHGYDPILKSRRTGKAKIGIDDVGVWIKGHVERRDAYEVALYEQGILKGLTGWSCRAAIPSGVEREQVGNTHIIKRWPLSRDDATITFTPAYPPRKAGSTLVVPLEEYARGAGNIKMLVNAQPVKPEATPDAPNGAANAADTKSASVQVIGNVGETNMGDVTPTQAPPAENEAIKALEVKLNKTSDALDKIVKFMESMPALGDAGYASGTGGGSDPAIKSLGDFLLAIQRGDTKRLETVYGTTKDISGETGASGAYTVPTEYISRLMMVNPQESPILARVTRFPIKHPSGKMPFLDQYFAPTAGVGQTALAGRVTTAQRAEGGTYTETQPQFEELHWLVSDAASGILEVTKEMRVDSAVAIEALLTLLIRRAVNSKLEYFVLRGNGAGQPLGILNADCLVSITPDNDNTFAYADAVEMTTRFMSFGAQPVWICHPSIMTDIAAFAVASGSPVVWASNLADRQPGSLLGAPLIMSEHMAQANGDNPLYADLSAYGLFELGGLYIDFSEHAAFSSGKDTWRFGTRVDGKPLLKNKITLADPTGSFTQSPFVLFDD